MAPVPVGTPGAAVFCANNVPSSVNLSPSTGTGYVVGDVLLCFAACRSGTATVATPSGWTQLLNVAGTNGRLALFGKIATVTNEAAPTVAWSGLTTGTSGSPCGARIRAFRDLLLDIDVTGTVENGSASTTVSASGAAMTIVTASDLVLCLSTRLDDVGTWSAPSGLTLINSNLTTSGADFSFAWAYGSGPAVGSFAPNDFGLSGASSFASSGVAIALKGVPPPVPDNETLIDDFNRADGQLDAGAGVAIWDQRLYYNPGSRTDLRIVGNRLGGIANWQNAGSKFELEASFDLLVDCVVPPASPNFEFGLFFCMTDFATDLFDGYGVFWGNGNWFMRRYTNGANQGNIATAASSLLAGDTVWIRKRGSDIKFYRRVSGGEYTLLMSATDATYGKGIFNIELSDVSQRWDNLRGGPKFIPTYYGTVSLPITFGKSVAGIQSPPSPYQAAVIGDGPTGYWRLNEASGVPLDISGANQHFLSENGATVAGVPGLLLNEPTAKARSFSGTSYVRKPGFTPAERYELNTFTIEFWIKKDDLVGATVLDQYNGGMSVVINTADGTITLNKSYVGTIAKTSILKVFDTNTHHVVITRAGIGGPVVFYVDGVSETPTQTNPNLDTATGVANNGLYLGSQAGGTPLNGVMDEVAIYPLVLTPAQVQNHYDIATHVPTTHYGSTSLSVTFGKDVKGQRKTFGQVVAPFTFSKDVRGQRKTFGQVTAPFIFGKDVSGHRTSFGQVSLPLSFGIATAGFRPGLLHYGSVALPVIFGKDVIGQRKTFGQTTSPFIFGKAVAGQRRTFSQVSFPLTFGITTAGIRVGLTRYGVVALPITFGKDVKGQRKAFGQIALPLAFGKDVQGQRKTFGQITFPIIFTKELAGRNHLFGMLSMQTLFGKETAGRRRTFSQLALPITFSKAVNGGRTTFGSIALPINATIAVIGYARVRHYGQLSLPIIFDKQVSAQRKTFGQVTAPFLFGEHVQGERRAFSSLDFPMDFLFDIETGSVGVHGELSLPIIISIDTDGRVKARGVILNYAEMVYLGAEPVIAVYAEGQKVWPST